MRLAVELSWLYLLAGLRRKVHMATLFVGLLLLALPSYINAFSLGVNAFERVSKDFGLTLIGLFGVGMAILLGSSSVPGDLQSRSIYPILARPIPRSGYLAAHLLSLTFLLGGCMLFLGCCLTASLGLKSGSFDGGVLIGVYGAFLQAVVVGAVCLTFSVVCSPALAGTIGSAVFLVGNMSGVFIRFFLVEDRDSAVSATLAKTLKGVLPNLTLFNIKDPVVHQIPLPSGYLLSISYYAVIWVVLLLALARLAFQRVDL
jgi:ABC-type transport system involved in multi-copper enzyme maturation permease subunit